MLQLRHAILSLAMCVGTSIGQPATADKTAAIEELSDVLLLDRVIAVMRDEGLAYGATLDEDMLDGNGGTFWAERVAQIYDVDRMQHAVELALATAMSDKDIDRSIAYFTTDTGEKALSLELSARIAMGDTGVEDMARMTYRDLSDDPTPRLEAIHDFVAAGDLVERNVAGALSATYQFYLGMAEGGVLDLSEREMIAEVYNQEPGTREETVEWLFGFLLMAYGPLTDEELQDYTRFTESPAGQALNAALFEGFDDMYRVISYALGLEIAGAMSASDL